MGALRARCVQAAVKDPNCDMAAHIVSPSEISITWNTSAASAYDTWTDEALAAKNGGGWGAAFAHS